MILTHISACKLYRYKTYIVDIDHHFLNMVFTTGAVVIFLLKQAHGVLSKLF